MWDWHVWEAGGTQRILGSVQAADLMADAAGKGAKPEPKLRPRPYRKND